VVPPILARLRARLPHGRPLTDAEISKASGLSIDRVFLIQHMTDWSSVGVGEMRMFLIGCGIDLCNQSHMSRLRAYIPRPGKAPINTWKFLRVSPDFRSKYEPLLRRYLMSLKKATHQTK